MCPISSSEQADEQFVSVSQSWGREQQSVPGTTDDETSLGKLPTLTRLYISPEKPLSRGLVGMLRHSEWSAHSLSQKDDRLKSPLAVSARTEHLGPVRISP